MTAGRLRVLLGAGGLLLAVAAPIAAPSTSLLPSPQGAAGISLAGVALAAAFGLGFVRPLWSLYVLVALVVLEGAVRKWVVNDLTVFLLKDFLALGIYAAVLPTLRREEWRRPWWLLAPLAGLFALAVLSVPLADSLSQAVVGLRSYVIYVPLLWAAPALLTTRRRALALTAIILALAAANGVLAVVQALAGPGLLNELVSGAVAGLITLQGVSYVRPAGTFMQVGVVAAFLFFGALAAFALLLSFRRGAWVWVALAGFGAITGGIAYSSARSLLGSVILAYALAAIALLLQRRYLTVLAMPAAFVVSFLLLINVVPWAQDRATELVHWAQRDDWVWVAIPVRPPEQPRQLRVPPETARGLDVRIRQATLPFDISGTTEDGREVVVRIVPPPPGTAGGPTSVVGERVTTVPGIDAEGNAIDVSVGGRDAPVGGFLGRAADFGSAGGEVGLWSGRIRPQLGLIADQRAVGHGTGTMTLGSGYGDAGPTVLQGEGMYSKAAWELGLAGLAAFVWLTAALAVASVLGYLRSDGWRRMVAAMAGAATLIMPIWYFFTFALDFPVVGILVYILAGCATAYAQSRRSGPSRASATSEASPASFPRNAGSN